MVLGIPEYRLPRALIAREIEAIVELGIDVETGVRVGDDAHARRAPRPARRAVPRGRHRPRARPRPARPRARRRAARRRVPPQRQPGLPRRPRRAGRRRRRRQRRVRRGPHRAPRRRRAATPHRRRSRSAATSDEDARRAMTTTLDVARAARRAGVLDVTIVALESPDEIPADPEEIDEAEREGIRIVYRRGPHRFVGDDDASPGSRRSRSRRCSTPRAASRRRSRPAPRTIMPADTSSSPSARPPTSSFLGGVDARAHPRGRRAGRSRRRCATSHPRIWAGGDVAHGPRNLIDAIADGRRAAASIHAALTGATGPRPGHEVRVELRTGLPAARQRLRRDPAPADPGDADRTARRLRRGRDRLRRARRPASRGCAACAASTTSCSRPSCASSAVCASTCARRTASRSRAPTTSALGTEQQSVLLLDEDLCIRCGLCVNRCPPGALSMVHARELDA